MSGADRGSLPATHLLLLLLICAAWGGNFLASAVALRELPALLFTALRLLLVGALMLPWLRPPEGGQWRRLLAVCLCNGALHFGLSFWAIRLAGDLASPAILLQAYVPMSALLAVLWLGEPLDRASATSIAISFAGVLLLGFDPLVLDAPLALALMLLSALALAIGTVLMRGLGGLHPFGLQAWSALIGLPPLLLASLWLEGDPRGHLAAAGPLAWTGVIYSALLASVLGHSLYYWLVRRHPLARVMPWLLIAPLVAIGLGVSVWGDRPGPRLWLGGAMVLGGVLALVIRRQPTTAAQSART